MSMFKKKTEIVEEKEEVETDREGVDTGQ